MAPLRAVVCVMLCAMLVAGCGEARESARMAGEIDRARNLFVAEAAQEEAQALADEFNTEAYDAIAENPFLAAAQNPLSTFSVDVDTASYANVRRMLNGRQMPPAGAVRIEEFVNYFSYDYPQPEGDVPFSVNVEIAGCPWTPGHKLARIGLKGREIELEDRPPTNLVFLLDVSGSMSAPNKLPLVKSAMVLLLDRLDENDTVAIAVYAGASGLVLPPTTADQKLTILSALDALEAGGSTNGGEGIRLAYETAAGSFIKDGANRVILCTDGDFNVGVTNQSDLVDLIQEKAAGGVFLSVLGFGMGNYKDSTLEKLADKGNGNYAYIDTHAEARKVLVEQLTGTLITIAKDVKVQVDFNPARVQSYRLIGYENRMLRAEDFEDDKKDAAEIGAGHTVTALYELVPVGAEFPAGAVTPSKYQQPGELAEAAQSDEIMTVRLRYKAPDADESQAFDVAMADSDVDFGAASEGFQFAAAVAGFGMLLRGSQHAGGATLDAVHEIAASSLGEDPHGYRREFLKLVEQADELQPERVSMKK